MRVKILPNISIMPALSFSTREGMDTLVRCERSTVLECGGARTRFRCWSPENVDWGRQGGRLYATGMSLLTLVVYYRHLPLYRSVFEEEKSVVE